VRKICAIGILAWSLVALPASSHAGSVLFSGSGVNPENNVTLNAEALFAITGDQLKITLRNTGDTSGNSKDASNSTLTGVFFDLPTGITLAPISAAVAPGSILQPDQCDAGACNGSTTNVGGEFAYGTGSWAPHAGGHGISSSGYLSGYGDQGNFSGPNLDSPDALNGINFGIIAPLALSPFKPNGGLANDPLIEGEVVFTLNISGGALLESQISNVSFQYGTGLNEPSFRDCCRGGSVPEPGAVVLMAPALALLFRRRWLLKAAC
jgi:hypothetical protein